MFMALRLTQPVKYLPSPHPVLTRLLQALGDDYIGTEELCHTIESDQSTVSRLLAVANSSYYCMRHQVNSVERAVVLLGLNEVRSICLGTVLMALMDSGRLEDRNGAGRLWVHSFAVQESAKLLAAETGKVDQATALTAGLLHDLGWVVIMAYYPDKWALLKRLVTHEKASPEETQAKLNEWHQEAGELLASHWDLPPVMAEVMSCHHNPDPDDTYFDVTGLVYVADHLATELGKDSGMHLKLEDSWKQATQKMGYSDSMMNTCKDLIETKFEEMESLWNAMTSQ